MKKIIMTMAALLISVAVFAQSSRDRLSELEKATVEEDTKPAKEEKEYKLFSFNILTELGFGKQFIEETQFPGALKDNKSSDFYFNMVEFGLNPTKWVSFTLGANLEWVNYSPSSGYYFHGVPDGDSRKLDLTAVTAAMNNTSSRLHAFSVVFPLALDLHVGSISVRAGAEANLRSKSSVQYSYKDANGDLFTVKDGTPTGLDRFTLNYFASLNFGFLGIYAKYFPQSISPTIPMHGFTVGIVLNTR